MDVHEKLKRVYTMEEMLGTITYQSQHIPTDLLSKEEYLEGDSSGGLEKSAYMRKFEQKFDQKKVTMTSSNVNFVQNFFKKQQIIFHCNLHRK